MNMVKLDVDWSEDPAEISVPQLLESKNGTSAMDYTKNVLSFVYVHRWP